MREVLTVELVIWSEDGDHPQPTVHGGHVDEGAARKMLLDYGYEEFEIETMTLRHGWAQYGFVSPEEFDVEPGERMWTEANGPGVARLKVTFIELPYIPQKEWTRRINWYNQQERLRRRMQRARTGE